MNDTNTPEQAYVVDGEYMSEAQYAAHRHSQLEALHQVFVTQRDEWVKHRANSGVEVRWRSAQALYLGDEPANAESSMVSTLKDGPTIKKKSGVTAQRSSVVVNIVRPKVDQAVARMCEILLPVDDKNWGIKPTPVPEPISKMLGNHQPMMDQAGQPTQITPDMQAQEIIKAAKDACESMTLEIDDVLNQCGYNGEQRRMIEDGVRLGTGFMLGPFPRNNTKRSWLPQEGGGMKLQLGSEVLPASMRADPWDIFTDPACGNDHHRGAGFFHRRYATKKELRALVGLPGYDAECIREVLRFKPTRTSVAEGRVMRNTADDDSYEMWVYYGQVEPEQMQMLSESMGDPLNNVDDGVVIMVGEKIIGAMESWIPDGSLPLDCWCWRIADDSPYGYGLPDEMGHQQRVVNAAWRQVMDNARMAIGGQLVMKKKMVVPQDGSYEMYPMKVWLASEDLEDVRQAMHMFEFASHIQELLTIATTAMQFADQETSMPQIMGGEKGTAPETVGGMIMLYNNANVVLRLRVKLYDDCVTRKHIGRHYDWQMANNPKPHIKCDAEVDARGSTALLEKDIQNQATLNLANVTSNPRYQAYLDPKEELRVVLKAFKVTPEDIMLTDAKIEQNMQKAAENPPQDPDMAKIQAQLEMKKMDMQDKAEDRAFNAGKQQAELEYKAASLEYNQRREQSERDIAMTEAQLTRDTALLSAASAEQESQLARDAKERLAALQIDSKHQMFNAEASLRVNTGQGI